MPVIVGTVGDRQIVRTVMHALLTGAVVGMCRFIAVRRVIVPVMGIRVLSLVFVTLFDVTAAGLTTVSMMDATSHDRMHEHAGRC